MISKKTSSLLLLFSIVTATVANAAQELSFGVIPYVSAGPLIQTQSPLKQYIAKVLGKPVNLVTAPDFRTFLDRTQKGEYDILFTAPHFGRLAEERDGYKSIVMTSHHVQGSFLARKDSPIKSLDDLNGKTVMIAQRLSMLFQLADATLQKKGLIDGKNITIIETRTHNNALYAPMRDEADASVTGVLIWHLLGQEFKDKLKVIGTTEKAPGFLLLVHPRMTAEIQNKLKDALLKFGGTPEGKAYFENTGFIGFEPISDNTMKALDPYTKVLRTKP